MVFKFDHALGSLGGFVKTQISGSHLTVFDLVDAQTCAFLINSQVMVMLIHKHLFDRQ